MTNKVLVFSTTFCANCPGVKKKLHDAGILFETVDALKNPQGVKEFNIKAVPTVLVVDENWENVVYQQTGSVQDIEKIKELIK